MKRKTYHYRERDERLTGQCHGCTIQLACKPTQFVNELVRGYMQNSKLNYIAGWAARCRCRGGGRGAVRPGRRVMHVGEVPRYKQIDPTTSELIALQADELNCTTSQKCARSTTFYLLTCSTFQTTPTLVARRRRI